MEIVTALVASIWLLFALLALCYRKENTAGSEWAGSDATRKEQELSESITQSCSNEEVHGGDNEQEQHSARDDDIGHLSPSSLPPGRKDSTSLRRAMQGEH